MVASRTKTQLTNPRYPIAMNEVTTWLNNTEEQLESVARQMSAAQWTLYSEGKRGEVDEKTQAFQKSFGHFETWKRVQELHLSEMNFPPQTRRRIELLYRILSREHVRARPQIHETITDAVSLLTRFRATLFDSSHTDSELQKILNAEPDRVTREAAWRAQTEIAHSLKQPILDLAILRNEGARTLGFSGFREIGLLTAGQDCNTLKRTLKHLKQSTDEAWMTCIQEQKSRLGLEHLRPWDMHFEDPELNMQLAKLLPKEDTLKHMKQSFLEMGINLDRAELTLDMESRDGKSQHAYCFPIDPPHDVRVLANISDGLASCETLFHEMGHAVQALNVKQSFYSLKDTPNDALSEGCAQLFAYLCHEPEWLKHSLKLDDTSIAGIQLRNRNKRLSSLRWMLVWVAIEEAIFQNPQEDPTPLFWDLYEEIIGLETTKELRGTPVWARVPHFVTHPIYVQNYVVAELVASQLKAEIVRQFGSIWGHKEVGPWIIRHCFEGGAELSSAEWMIKCTGSELGISDYIADVISN